ncbi:spore germination protein [Cohnella boryungensis]|uniref:Spore germination protein n=1 Tax=Cohnella boryungensis TaxID=768479 RepID=A0ABV8SFD9_9BACL
MPKDERKLSGTLQDNAEAMKETIGHSPDVQFRPFHVGGMSWQAMIVYIDGLVDKKTINEQVMKPLMHAGPPSVGEFARKRRQRESRKPFNLRFFPSEI